MVPIKFAMATFGVLVVALIAFFMIRGIPEPLHGYYPEEPEELPPRSERLQCAPKTCSFSQINFWLIETQKTQLVFPYLRSIESVFYFHPNAIVNIYSNTLVDTSVLQLLRKGYDIRLIRFDLANISAEIPQLKAWYDKGAWKEDKYFEVNLSNLLRFYAIWHYGGVYIDTDVVILKPFDELNNTLGWQDNFAEVNTAVLYFDAGHPLVLAFIQAFAENYTPSIWGKNGVLRLNSVLGVVKSDSDLIDRGYDGDYSDVPESDRWKLKPKNPKWRPRVPNVRIVKSSYFYPIDYRSWNKLKSFDEQTPYEHLQIYEKLRNESYALHWWNKMFEWHEKDNNRVIPRGTILHMLLYCFERCYRFPWELDAKARPRRPKMAEYELNSKTGLINRYLEYHYSQLEIILLSLVFGVLGGLLVTSFLIAPCMYCLCIMMNSHRDRGDQ